MKRWPAISKTIKEISEDDKRVKIFGVIVGIDHANGKISIDDSTGVASVFFNSIELIDKLEQYKVGDTVMAIGWANGNSIDGEILRKVEGFEPSRYKNVLEVWENVRSKIERSKSVG